MLMLPFWLAAETSTDETSGFERGTEKKRIPSQLVVFKQSGFVITLVFPEQADNTWLILLEKEDQIKISSCWAASG